MKKTIMAALAFLLIIPMVFSSIGTALPNLNNNTFEGLTGNVVTEITDVTMATKRAADTICMENCMRVLTTDTGTYGVFITKAHIMKNMGNGTDALNEFVLVKLDGESSIVLGTGYTISGEVDLVADQSGEIYVVCGGNRLKQKKASDHRAARPVDFSVEQAVLNVWHYNSNTGILDGYGTRSFAFDQPGDYEYVTSVLDDAKNEITMLFQGNYEGENYLSWFVFDLNRYRWTGKGTTAKVSNSIGTSYSFLEENGGKLLVSINEEATEIRSIRISDTVADIEESLLIAGSTLTFHDAYVDLSGKLHILYAEGDKLYHYDGKSSEMAIDAGMSVRMGQNQKGIFYILAMKQNENAALQIYYSADGSTYTSVYDYVFPKVKVGSNSTFRQPIAPFSVSTLRNGSLQNDKVAVMFPANYFGTPDWHYYEIDFNGNAGGSGGTETPDIDSVKVDALQFGASPSFEEISEGTWGAKSGRASLGAQNSAMVDNTSDKHLQEMYMDTYLRWDSEYLYIGVETNELDSYMPCLGGDESWKGDALQILIDPLGSGETTSAKSVNISYGFTEDGKASVWKHGVGENITESCKTGFKQIGDKLQFMIAIPASIIKGEAGATFTEGEEVGLAMVRWSGTAGVEDWNGALAWGYGIAPGLFSGLEGSNSVTFKG